MAPEAHSVSSIRQAERIFWVGCGVGFAWGVMLGVTFGIWVTA